MGIDNVAPCLSPSVIGAYRSQMQEAAAWVRAAAPCCERYHGGLMGANCRGGSDICVCMCMCVVVGGVSLIWLIPLCVMSMMAAGGGSE